MTDLKPFLIFVLLMFLPRLSIAQNTIDTTKISDGKTYMFLLAGNYECIGTILNHSEKELMVNVKKQGIIEIHKSDIRSIKEVSKNAMKNEHALLSKNEIGFGYGVSSAYKIKNPAIPFHQSIFSVNYKRYYSQYISAGIDFVFDYQAANMKTEYGQYIYSIKNSTENISLAPEISICYFDKNKRENNFYVQLYGSLSFGLRYSRDKTDSTHYSYGSIFIENGRIGDFLRFSYQISPLGIRVGRALAAYIELGYGSKGVINLGIDIKSHYKLKPPSLLAPPMPSDQK